MIFYQLIALLGVHWFADFVTQTEEQAKGKSSSIRLLLEHTATYAAIMGAWSLIIVGPIFAGLFTVAMFVTHTPIDYVTSQINRNLWAKGEVHTFFVSVGFDQYLHQITIILALMWL